MEMGFKLRCKILQADLLLDTAMPALRRLKELELTRMALDTFPGFLAAALKSLTLLSLGGNCFTRIPQAVSQMTTLKSLSLHRNLHLELDPSDLKILGVLTALTSLGLSKSESLTGSARLT